MKGDMSQFGPALEFLLDSEDRPRSYQPVVDNNGGTVVAGINSKSYPDQVAAILALPKEQRSAAVYKFYFAYFWQPLQLGGLDAQDVATRVLDMAVNAGPNTAVKLLQAAVNAISHCDIAEYGHMGPKTLAACNSCDPQDLLASYRSQRVIHYNKIVANKPEDAKYLAGWLSRAER